MTFAALDLLLPVVLAVHNVDEFSRCDDFIRACPARVGGKPATRRVVRDAAILLTLAVTVLSGFTFLFKGAALTTISQVAVFALLFNGIVHCILSAKRRAMIPGTRSAVILVLPYSVLTVVAMRTDLKDPVWSLLRYALFGALTAPLAILSFLWLSSLLSRLAVHLQTQQRS